MSNQLINSLIFIHNEFVFEDKNEDEDEKEYFFKRFNKKFEKSIFCEKYKRNYAGFFIDYIKDLIDKHSDLNLELDLIFSKTISSFQDGIHFQNFTIKIKNDDDFVILKTELTIDEEFDSIIDIDFDFISKEKWNEKLSIDLNEEKLKEKLISLMMFTYCEKL